MKNILAPLLLSQSYSQPLNTHINSKPSYSALSSTLGHSLTATISHSYTLSTQHTFFIFINHYLKPFTFSGTVPQYNYMSKQYSQPAASDMVLSLSFFSFLSQWHGSPLTLLFRII